MKPVFKLMMFGLICLAAATTVEAQGKHAVGRSLTPQEIERVKEYKALIGDVDQKPVTQVIDELEQTRYPRVNLQMKEAMARVYAEIVKDKNVEGKAKKAWLYSMINLNMAYLQFEGTKDSGGNTEPLNKLIRRKLKECLPADIAEHPGFRCSLG